MTTCIAPEITQAPEQFQTSAAMSNLSRLAMQFHIAANVQVESRILHDFSALNFAEGVSTGEAILAVLAFRRPLLDDGIMSVCLVRRRDGNNIVADLQIYCRDDAGHETIFLRLGKVRQL